MLQIWLINFQRLNRQSSVLVDKIPPQLDREGIKEGEDGERGRGDYSRVAIILNISIKRGAIIRGRRLIEGRLKEIR